MQFSTSIRSMSKSGSAQSPSTSPNLLALEYTMPRLLSADMAATASVT